MRRALLVLGSALGLAAGLAATAPPVEAHGGRFRGGTTFQPRAPIRPDPRPPGAPPRPTTGGAGTVLTAPPIPGSGEPTTSGPLADTDWSTWWMLNRWAYLPRRGAALDKAPVTPPTGGDAALETLAERRRALLARQLTKPFLLKQLADPSPNRATARAAAAIALAKISADQETLERLLTMAEGGRSTGTERESAVLAVGLLRRTATPKRLDGASLDAARKRLLPLLKDRTLSLRGRCFAAFALGLLADQGYSSPFTEDGKLVIRGLVGLLEGRGAGIDLRVAALTALGLQPKKGVPSAAYDNLRASITGGRAWGRKWTPLTQAHALTTYAKLGGPAWVALLQRSLANKRAPEPVRRAARLALGSEATRLSHGERITAAQALLTLTRSPSDPVAAGTAQLALGRVVRADLADGSTALLKDKRIMRALIDRLPRAPSNVRGFYVLALALSARDVDISDETIARYAKTARAALLKGLTQARGTKHLQGAYVVGLGLLRAKEARDPLVKILKDVNAGPGMRGRAAIALAAQGASDDEVLVALQRIIADKSPTAPRGEAALALSLITGVPASKDLIEQLRSAKSLRQQTAAAMALGQLDDPKALPAIIEVASQGEGKGKSKNLDELRALAIAVLGLLGDPEERPSIFLLSLDANYIARTDALQEAFSLL